MDIHRIMIPLGLSVVAWQVTCVLLIQMSFLQFFSIEILIAFFKIFSTFVTDKKEGKSKIFEDGDGWF